MPVDVGLLCANGCNARGHDETDSLYNQYIDTAARGAVAVPGSRFHEVAKLIFWIKKYFLLSTDFQLFETNKRKFKNMLFKFIISITGGHFCLPGFLKTKIRHCSSSYFDRAEKSACVSGVNQCRVKKRHMLKMEYVCVMMTDRITKFVTVWWVCWTFSTHNTE
jgi:hypothetical protein